jgi:hypothetical protein
MTQLNISAGDALPSFSLGQVVFTVRAMQELVADDIFTALKRHRFGDWGDLDASDKQENENALLYGGRLLSAYHDRKGVKFWIITEHGRNQTTVLLPSDY